MSDRTTVTLTISTTKVCEASAEFTALGEDEYEANGGFSVFVFNKIKYGDLPFLEKLKNNGIAYDSSWANGAEFNSGTEYCRFTDEGEAIVIQVYDEDLNPPFRELEKRFDDPAALIAFIKQHKESKTPLAWDHQERNAARFLVRQLIAA